MGCSAASLLRLQHRIRCLLPGARGVGQLAKEETHRFGLAVERRIGRARVLLDGFDLWAQESLHARGDAAQHFMSSSEGAASATNSVTQGLYFINLIIPPQATARGARELIKLFSSSP